MSKLENTCIVGLQWGDEGKGKIVDFLAEKYDYVVRYCGGANAGHSVQIDGQKEKFALHLIPCGLLRPGVISVVGNGVVIDPAVILHEVDGLRQRGVEVSPKNLKISYKAHLVMPWHPAEDAAREGNVGGGGQVIGTTRRGIGPTYAEKMHRSSAFRMADLLYPDELAVRMESIGKVRSRTLQEQYGQPALDIPKIVTQYHEYAKLLAPFVTDTTAELLEVLDQGKTMLFEGAHGFLLDIDHGTFPFVTSSSCSPLGVCAGAGVPPQAVEQYFGVIKAYSTRVGAGPFPTEQDNDLGNRIRERGHEYGTTTGRPRRCGWFDAVAARYAVRLGGINKLAVTLLDVLGGLDELCICTGYELDGKRLPLFHTDARVLNRVQPVYERLPGWKEDIGKARKFEELPKSCRAYVERLEQLCGAPVGMVSVGPARGSTILR